MTTKHILQALKRRGKPIKQAQLYRYFQALGIKPRVRQRPAKYPADTVDRLANYLSLPPETSDTLKARSAFGKAVPIISMKQIKAGKPRPFYGDNL